MLWPYRSCLSSASPSASIWCFHFSFCFITLLPSHPKNKDRFFCPPIGKNYSLFNHIQKAVGGKLPEPATKITKTFPPSRPRCNNIRLIQKKNRWETSQGANHALLWPQTSSIATHHPLQSHGADNSSAQTRTISGEGHDDGILLSVPGPVEDLAHRLCPPRFEA
jgi:hypothetical protein